MVRQAARGGIISYIGSKDPKAAERRFENYITGVKNTKANPKKHKAARKIFDAATIAPPGRPLDSTLNMVWKAKEADRKARNRAKGSKPKRAVEEPLYVETFSPPVGLVSTGSTIQAPAFVPPTEEVVYDNFGNPVVVAKPLRRKRT